MIKNIYMNVTKKQAVFFTTVFILFTAIVLPFVATYTSNAIGVSESPDTSFNFNINQLFALIDSYGNNGRRIYIVMRWTFDVIWPVVYTLFFISSISYLARTSKYKLSHVILLFPLTGTLFDFLENVFATILMISYPNEYNGVAYLLISSSIIKWLFITLSFVIVTWLLLIKIIEWNKVKINE